MKRIRIYQAEESGGEGAGSGESAAPEVVAPAAAASPPSAPETTAAEPAADAPVVAELKAQMAAVLAENETLKAQTTAAQAEAQTAAAAAADAAKKARTDAVKTALTKASVVARGQAIALTELGDLDLEKEADQAKLSAWIQANTDYFVRPGTGATAPATPAAPAGKAHWLADHMAKLMGS